MRSEDMFSRERAAGYDPEILGRSAVAVIGCGAGGNQFVQTLALVGLREIRLVDPDVIEPSNLARSPLFARQGSEGKRKRWKAKELAEAFLRLSHASDPVARFALAPIESLGAGAFHGVGAIVAAVDSLEVRAHLSDQARLLGIPFVESGLSHTRGQVSVFANRSAEEACWRCAHPHVEGGAFSCTLAARQAVSKGLVPATQTIAAFVSALAAEHAIRALQDDFPLAGRIVSVDLRSGQSRVALVTPDPRCPGAHRRWEGIVDVEAGASDTVAEVIGRAATLIDKPVLHLPAPYLAEAPCSKCGAIVHVGRPAWAVREPPACKTCPEVRRLGAYPPVIVTTVRQGDELARRRARDLGLAPGAVVEATGSSGTESVLLRLRGSVDDLFVTRRRLSNEAKGGDMGHAG